jgi:hypothetical protein
LTPDTSRQTGLLAGVGVTPAEAALFNVVHYGLCVPPDDLARRAASPDYSLSGRLPVEECRTALAGCLAKGWLQIIDEVALKRIAAEIREAGLIGPIYGMPWDEGVDFTHAGAAMWHRLQAALRAGRERCPFAFTDVVRCRVAKYLPTRAAALAEIEDVRKNWGPAEVTGPTPFGPWRVRWWQRFPEGYRVDVEWRSHWQGRCGEGEGWFHPRSPRWRTEPDRRRQVLDRFGVGLSEWLVLCEMAGGSSNYPTHLPARVVYFAMRDLGFTPTEEECRTGLDACLAKGWVRIIDCRAAAEIEAMLRADPAIVLLPDEVIPGDEEVDFTPAGAALYRAISEEFLGPGWEDDLSAWKELDREEHRYGETEADILSALQEYENRRLDVVASRVVPIGPWGVYWWERFPSGYRLEVDVRGLDRDGP